MNDFKNVLLLHPCDKTTIDRAARLLQTHHSQLTVFHVVPKLERPHAVSVDRKKIDLQKLLVKEYQAELETVAGPLSNKGIRVHRRVAVGKSFLEITRQVISKKHDLVIMTADGIGHMREQLFGATSHHLMRKCPCPVWIVKPTRRKKLRRILAAVDPVSVDDTRDSLNSQILQRANRIASMEGGELQIVHAWTTLGGETRRSRRWMTKQEIRLYTEQVAADHRQRLNKLLEKHPNCSGKVHMIQGKPSVVIPSIAHTENADLLVMGTVCRTGIPGVFIGNTAEMVLSEVNCSVLTIKPDEFVTPVTLE